MEIKSVTSTILPGPRGRCAITEVINTLVNWLRRMAGSYVGHLGTKIASLRSVCLYI
jgi:hypothetical protein